MGSYCGRVRVFLAAVYGDFQRLPGGQAMIAQTAPPAAIRPPPASIAVTPPPVARPIAETRPAAPMVPIVTPTAQVPQYPVENFAQSAPALLPQPSVPNRSDQIKTILAAIGIIAILFHAVRLVGANVG